MCAGSMPISAIRPEPGPSRGGLSPRSSGIPENYPRVGFIVTNMSRPAERVVAFYNKRGTCEQWIKEGKGAIKWTRLSCRTFAASAVRLQLHALAYNLGNFLRTLATPEPGRFVDAYQSSGHDFALITRTAKNNDAQRWIVIPSGRNTITIQQKSSGRFMDAHEIEEKDLLSLLGLQEPDSTNGSND